MLVNKRAALLAIQSFSIILVVSNSLIGLVLLCTKPFQAPKFLVGVLIVVVLRAAGIVIVSDITVCN